MDRFPRSTVLHVGVLMLAYALCTLPNLGAPSLWDVDEGVNAECAREMMEAGTWIVPTFNYELRAAKPAMLYWWQMAAYSLFGISEWSARLPSVLAGLGSVLLTYSLARRMFDPMTGLLAGLMLTASLEFCLLSHTASPDALLLFFSMLAFHSFWRYSQDGRRGWWLPTAAACGLAMLTKGPIGVALPGLIILSYFAWNRELKRLWDKRFIHAALLFAAVALPWYILVGIETRGQFLKIFFGRENLSRFATPMENHGGNPLFHPLALFVGFAPGSVFLILSLWEGVRLTRPFAENYRAYRFLIFWFGATMLVFSLSATKLPNYVLPLYPATAILCGRFLERWRVQAFSNYRWSMPAALGGLAVVGLVAIGGLVVAGGAVELPIKNMRIFPGLASSFWAGALPLVGATAAAVFLIRQQRDRVVACVAIASVAFAAGLAAFPILDVDARKAPKSLAEMAHLKQPERDIRIASLFWFKPSTVFYSRREIRKLDGLADVQKFLGTPRESYLLIAEPVWDEIKNGVNVPTRTVARQYDFYENKNVLVIGNSMGGWDSAAHRAWELDTIMAVFTSGPVTAEHGIR